MHGEAACDCVAYGGQTWAGHKRFKVGVARTRAAEDLLKEMQPPDMPDVPFGGGTCPEMATPEACIPLSHRSDASRSLPGPQANTSWGGSRGIPVGADEICAPAGLFRARSVSLAGFGRLRAGQGAIESRPAPCRAALREMRARLANSSRGAAIM